MAGSRPAGRGWATVRAATPGADRWFPVALSWASALAGSLLFLGLGRGVDLLLAGEQVPGGLLAVLVAAAVAGGLFTGLGSWQQSVAAGGTEARLRRSTIAAILAAPVTSTMSRSGTLLALATGTVERVARYRGAFLGPITGSLTVPFLVLAVMAVGADAVVAGWLALLVLAVPLLIVGFQRLVRPIGAAYRRSQARLTSAFLESIQALETLVHANAAQRRASELAEAGEQHRRQLMRLLAGNQLIIGVVDAGFSLTVVVSSAVLASTRVTAGQLSPGQAVSIVLLTLLVTGPVDLVGQFFYVGIAGRAAQARLAQFLGAPVPEPSAGRVEVVESAPAIELNGVSAAWPGGPRILHGLDLRIERGERVALVGPSGIGKSTVSALLQGILTPSDGSVRIHGVAVDGQAGLTRRLLSVVEQRTFLLTDSVRANLLLAAPAADDQALWRALEVAGLRAEMTAMPQQLDTPVGEQGGLLSGGQVQRLAIARAVLRDAPILILDEPTSQVDLAAEAAVLAALDRLAVGRTVLMIAHRPGAILAADRVVDLSQVLR